MGALPGLAASLELITDPQVPARVYLFKDGRPFRLSPVQALLPLRVDLFYRECLWRSSEDPQVLEVTCNDQSHFFLLKGRASFDLPLAIIGSKPIAVCSIHRLKWSSTLAPERPGAVL